MICMFPNFAACLELNHSCNEQRKERSGELCAQSEAKRSRTKVLQATISANSPHLAFGRWPNGVGLAVVSSALMLFIPCTSFCCGLLWGCYWWCRNQIPVHTSSTSEDHHPALWQKQDSLSALQLSLEITSRVPAPCRVLSRPSAEGMGEMCRAEGNCVTAGGDRFLLQTQGWLLWKHCVIHVWDVKQRTGPSSLQDQPFQQLW